MRNRAPITTYLVNHWRGHHDLLLTLLVSMLGLRLVLGIVQPVVPSIVIWPWLLLSLVVLIWQLVGHWRAVDAHLRSGGGMVLLWTSYMAMVVIVALSILQWLDALVSRAPPAVAPAIETMQLPIDSSASIVTLSGPLSWEMHSALERALEGDHQLRQVTLDSTGGLVFGARALALLIERHQLNTHIDNLCYSACTLVFLAGGQRSLAAGAKLGFHRYAIDEPNRVQTINVAEELAKDRAYLLRRGVTADFVESVFRAAPDDMWVPTHQQLLQAGVIRSLRG